MKISGKYSKPNYSVLSHIYDTLMEDVNYEMWADYIDEIIQEHHPAAEAVLELACGTGTLALLLDELGVYVITATDASGEMIKRATEKAGPEHSDIVFRTMNFLNIDLKEQYDVVFMVFDSLNYIHTEEEILELHRQVSRVLRPGGFFIYDLLRHVIH